MYIKELHVNHPNSYAVVHMSYGEITALANGMYELVSNLELLKITRIIILQKISRINLT